MVLVLLLGALAIAWMVRRPPWPIVSLAVLLGVFIGQTPAALAVRRFLIDVTVSIVRVAS